MAHFAELDENNIVLRVIVVANEVLLDQDGHENEDLGIAFCQDLFGGKWIQTSYNKTFRANFAGIGCVYDADKDVFITQNPYDSWILDENTYHYVAPFPRPDDNQPHRWIWDENERNWVMLT